MRAYLHDRFASLNKSKHINHTKKEIHFVVLSLCYKCVVNVASFIPHRSGCVTQDRLLVPSVDW